MGRCPVGPPGEIKMNNHQKLCDTVLLFMSIIAAWFALSAIVGESALADPLVSFLRAGQLIIDPSFLKDIASTFKALGLSLVIAIVGGIILGVILGTNKLVGAVGEPFLVGIYSLPKITLYPILLLIFGLGLPAKVAFGALHGMMPVAVFTLAAVRSIKPVYLKYSRVSGFSAYESGVRIILPACIPNILAGVRVGFSLTLLGVMLAELFASQSGIGHALIRAIERAEPPTFSAIALILFSFAISVNLIILSIEKKWNAKTY